MGHTTKTFYTLDELSCHLKMHRPSFYFSSKTSTVIPYDKIGQLLGDQNDLDLCDLSKLPSQMELLESGNVMIKGGVSWDEAKKFLKSKGRNLKTSPTEQLALITAGVATSCTGERCFGFGNMRSQVVRLKYLNYLGEEKSLSKFNKLDCDSIFLGPYQQEFSIYQDFKNAPYPRFENETDLMIGTEGQLGIVTEVELETTPDIPVTYVFILVDRWENNYQQHLEIFRAVQNLRNSIFSCELLDSNCMNYLKPDERLGQNQDVIFLEIKTEDFEDIYANVLCEFKTIPNESIFEMAENKFHHVRAAVPRAIFEVNSQMGVIKMGTDVQVSMDHYEDLLKFYQKASSISVRYCLFGHFGDAHLHFNYMPTKDQTNQCLDVFNELYSNVLLWKGSPFAEHGIGLIKQKYISKFHSQNQRGLFKDLKKIHDPFNQFFPMGFMSMNYSSKESNA